MKRDSFLIEADELLERLDDENVRIYDTTMLFFKAQSGLTAYERYLQGHIPGAAFFDHQQFSEAQNPADMTILPAAELAKSMGDIGISAESEVILYSAEAIPAATRAWWVLRYAGHNHVRVLNGGLAAWKQAGGAVEQGARSYEAAVFQGQPRPEMFASKEEIMAAMDDGDVHTINTLNVESYDSAHIVGSTCVPAFDLMQNLDSFSPDELIQARLAEESASKRIITYCGGGIAATVNAMAHLMVGHENVAVYDGSMSEWVREGLPTAGTNPKQWVVWPPK